MPVSDRFLCYSRWCSGIHSASLADDLYNYSSSPSALALSTPPSTSLTSLTSLSNTLGNIIATPRQTNYQSAASALSSAGTLLDPLTALYLLPLLISVHFPSWSLISSRSFLLLFAPCARINKTSQGPSSLFPYIRSWVASKATRGASSY